MVSRRALHTARTALWITCGWIGAALLVRTFFYVTLCAVVIHVVTMSLLGLSELGGLLACSSI